MFSHVGRDAAAGARFAAGWVDSDRTARFNGVNFVFKCRSPPRPLLSVPSIRRQRSVITIKHDDTIASGLSDNSNYSFYLTVLLLIYHTVCSNSRTYVSMMLKNKNDCANFILTCGTICFPQTFIFNNNVFSCEYIFFLSEKIIS